MRKASLTRATFQLAAKHVLIKRNHVLKIVHADDLSLPKIPSAVWSSGSTFVSMMESPDFGDRDDLSAISLVCQPWIGRILVEREMGS